MKNLLTLLFYSLSVSVLIGQVVNKTRFSVLDNTPGHTILRLDLTGIDQRSVQTPQGEAVVVSAPDPKYGEHATAVLRMLPGHDLPALPEVQAHFKSAGMARQKWPEELLEVADFPRTASGKVQKFKVRQLVAAR